MPETKGNVPYRTNWRSRIGILLTQARWRRAYKVEVNTDYVMAQLQSQNFRCYYTGESLSLNADKYNAVSIDRLDNALGYVVGNVVITTWGINRAKSNRTAQEFIDLCKRVSSHQSLREVEDVHDVA